MRLLARLFILMCLSLIPFFTVAKADDSKLEMRKQVIEFANKNLIKILLGYSLNGQQGKFWTNDALAYALIQKPEIIYNTPFDFVSDAEFKVVGVEPERLAINTGEKILFNAERLATMPEFSVFDAVKILLHEYNHFISELPRNHGGEAVKLDVEMKDKLGVDVVEHLKSSSLSVQTPYGETTILQAIKAKNMRLIREYLTIHDTKTLVEETFLAWQISANRFEAEETQKKLINHLGSKDEYVFNLNIDLSLAQKFEHKWTRYIPEITLESAQYSTTTQDIVIQSKYLPRYFSSEDSRQLQGLALPEYKRTFSLSQRSFNFREAQNKNTFVIENTVQKEAKRFVTINLNRNSTFDPMKFKKQDIVVLGRDKHGRKYSFPALKIGERNENNAFVIFEIPNEFTISVDEVLCVDRSDRLKFRENSIRPQKPQIVQGAIDKESDQSMYGRRRGYKFNDFDLRAWDNNQKYHMKLTLNDPLEITGITIELRVPVLITDSHAQARKSYYVTGEKKILFDE